MKYVRNTYTGTDSCVEAFLAAKSYADSIGAELIMSFPEGVGIPPEDLTEVDGYDLYLDELLNNGAIITLPT